MTIIVVLVILSVTSVLAQDYIVDPLSVQKCQTSNGSEDVDFDLELQSKDGEKYFQMKVKLNRTINDQCTFRTTTDIKAGSDFVHYLDADGSACESISNMMEPAWERLKEELDPPMGKDCEIKPGTYTLTNYQVMKEEVNEPIPAEGYFRSKTYLICEGVEVVCLETEFLVSEEDSN